MTEDDKLAARFSGVPFTGPEQRKFILRLLGGAQRARAFHATLGPGADLKTAEGIETLCEQMNKCFDAVGRGECEPHVIGDSRRNSAPHSGQPQRDLREMLSEGN